VRLSRNVVQDLFVQCSFRDRDSVMSMVFDMNKAFIEDNYIDVLGGKLRRLLLTTKKKNDNLEYIRVYRLVLAIEYMFFNRSRVKQKNIKKVELYLKQLELWC
jgi:hypothetical protein